MSERDVWCRYCRRYAGAQVFHTRGIWQDITGKDEPRVLPACRVTVHEEQCIATVETWQARSVKAGRAPQPCEPRLTLIGRIRSRLGLPIGWEATP